MAYQYLVNYATSPNGPWPTATQQTVTNPTITLTGLNPTTNYYIQIITVDTVTGLQSAPVVSAAFETGVGEATSGTLIGPVPAGTQSASMIISSTPGTPGSQTTIYVNTGGSITVINGGTTYTPTSSNVQYLYYLNHAAYQENTSGNWYGAITTTSTGTGGQLSGSPIPTITGISLSSASVNSGAASGTTVGTFSTTGTCYLYTAPTTNAFTFSGTYSLSGANSPSFTISGNTLLTNGALANGTYTILVTATYSGTFQGATVAPYTTSSPITITVGATVPVGALQAAANGAAKNYTVLAMNADWSNTNQLAYHTSINGSGQYQGGPAGTANANSWLFSVCGATQTTPVLNSSNCYITNAGFLYMNPSSGSNNNIYTAPTFEFVGSYSTPGNIQTNNGNGTVFQYGYFEASLSFVLPQPSGAGTYPAFWGSNANNTSISNNSGTNNGWVSGTTNTNGQLFPHVELDFLEVPSYTGSSYSQSNTSYNGDSFPSQTIHQWQSTGSDPGNGGNTGVYLPTGYSVAGPGTPVGSGTSITFPNAQFNTWGCLWTPTTVIFYINNQVTTFYNGTSASSGFNPVSTTNSSANLNGQSFSGANQPGQGIWLDIGTGGGWPMLCDYVRVWQY